MKKYNEDLLVELIADGRLTQGQIAEKVGISRRTVWRIEHGLSRPELQRKIAAVMEGYRQAAIRAAARHMTNLIEKQVQVAMSGDGETARKCREFLLKTLMLSIPEQASKAPPPEPAVDEEAQKAQAEKVASGLRFHRMLGNLTAESRDRMIEELGGPCDNTPQGQYAEPNSGQTAPTDPHENSPPPER